MVEPQAAATVIIARECLSGFEIFMLRRSSRSAFMPDVYVFPGGRVEAQDGEEPARERLAGAGPVVDAPGGLDRAFIFAAVRETFEEAGLLFATEPIAANTLAAARTRVLAGALTFTQMLRDLDTRVDERALCYFSRWITPAFETRRFDTRFFVARAPAGQAAQADESETHDGLWVDPRQALARFAAGHFALIFPTIKHLERLSTFSSVDALLDFALNKPIQTVMPDVDEQRQFHIPSALEGAW